MRRTFLIAGVFLLAVAAVASNGAIEAFFGRHPGELSWGPTLFRLMLAFHAAVLLVAYRTFVPGEPPRPARGPLLARWEWLALSGLTVVAVALRLYRLGDGLWLDEILTLTDFVRLPLSGIVTSFPSQNQHMLYSLLARLSVDLLGESAAAVRLPSVLFGAGSIWALYLLGRGIVGARAAMLACLLMTLSYHHIWFSQNARGYMGLLFFTTLATWLWLEGQRDPRWRWWILYAVACFLGAWIHMTMVFVAVSHALIWGVEVLLRKPESMRTIGKPLVAWTLAATLTIQGHALALPEFFRSALHEASNDSEWTNPLWVVTEAVCNLKIGFSGSAILICGAVFVLLGWWSIVRRSPRAGFAMVLAPVMGGGLMLALGHNLWPRFFFFAMGFALLIVAEGAFYVPRVAASLLAVPAPGVWAMRAGTAFLLLVSAVSALTVPRCYAPKQDFAGARDFAEQIRKEDRIAAIGLAGMVYQRYLAPHWSFPKTAMELRDALKRDPNLILLYSLPIELRAFHPEVWRVVEADFETIRVFPGTLGGGEVFVCRPRGLNGGRAHESGRAREIIEVTN
jgi:4-amino-4-deoxy-L-arabinose transferase-like glycosyltransferase